MPAIMLSVGWLLGRLGLGCVGTDDKTPGRSTQAVVAVVAGVVIVVVADHFRKFRIVLRAVNEFVCIRLLSPKPHAALAIVSGKDVQRDPIEIYP